MRRPAMPKRVATEDLIEIMGPKLARRKIDDARELALQVLGELESMGRILAVDATGYSLAAEWVKPTSALGWAEFS
jgi:hypothetical protein